MSGPSKAFVLTLTFHHVLGILFVASVLAPAAMAQEVEKRWSSNASLGQTRATERAVQQDIENLYARYQAHGAFGWHVQNQTVAGKKTIYSYRIKPAPIRSTDWVYRFNNQEFGSEEAFLEALVAIHPSDPQCPAAVVVPGEWRGIPGGGAGSGDDGSNEGEDNTLLIVAHRTSSEGACSPTQRSQYAQRNRTVKCPNPITMEWHPELEACGMSRSLQTSAAYTMSYWSTPLPKQCDSVGNPCDPTTGNKHQPEPDLDFGWVRFDRHYHSLSSTVGGAFGPGWTHSHNLRLAMGFDQTTYIPGTELIVGLIEADGTQSAFQETGTQYEAIDGSGDRIVQQGDNWVLYRADEVLTFGTNGLLLERVLEDGTTLGYTYDARSRLLAIYHSSGRRLDFHYTITDSDDLVSGLSVAGQTVVSYAYNAHGQVASATYADGGTRTYHYEDDRFPQYLTGITAEDDRRYSWFAYDAKGRVTCSRHSGDCTQGDIGIDGVRLTYTASGGTVVTDALGRVSTYALTPSGTSGLPRKVSAIADSQGAVSRTYYDEAIDFRRRMDTVTDRRGIQTKHAYAQASDPISGQLVSVHTVTEALGLPEQRVNEAHTDVASNRMVLNRVGNRETRITRNTRLQPVSIAVRDVISNETRTTTLSYCEAADIGAGNGDCPQVGLLKTVDGPHTDIADVTTYAYYGTDDAGCVESANLCLFRKGDLHTVTNALGHVTETLAYDSLGRPLSVMDSNGVVTDYEYHPRGWPTAIIVRGSDAGSDRTTRISYWPTGQVQEVVEPDGATVTYIYDAAQRLTDIADNAGNTLHYILDNAGNRLQEDAVDTDGTLRRTLSRVYNTLGQLAELKDASNHTTTYGYDANGNLQVHTDALQRVSTRNHDPLNRLVRTLQDIDGIAAEVTTQYGALDKVAQVTDPKGLHTTYAYNGFGELTQQGSPDTGVTQLTRDAAGNVATRIDARGVVETHAYDALNRLMAVQYPTPGSDVAFTYDVAPAACQAGEQFPVGRLSGMIDGSGQTSYCYNRFGEMTRKVQQTNGQTLVVRYAYTIGGRLASVTYPDGTVVDYVRDALGRTTEVGVATSGGSRQVLLTEATYLPFGPSTGWQYGNGRSLARSYDLDYRPVGVVDSDEALKLAFGYDPVGHLTVLSVGSQQAVLDYDALGRLTHYRDAPTNAVIDQYSYDAAGNRLSFSNSAGTALYAYPLDSHRLTSVDGIARSYDQVGNTIAIGGTSRQFVYDDRNRMVQVKQGGVVTRNYAYNGKGERVRHWLGVDDSLSVYNESGQWLGDYDASGLPKQQVVWMDDMPVGVLANGSLHYIEPDHLGTPRLVVDAVRDVPIWRWDASGEVFGNTVPNQDPDGDAVDFVFDMRFPGQRYDAASGFNYNYFRDYEPGIGRYVQSDPIGLEGGLATYAYVKGSPISFVDPQGLDRQWGVGGGGTLAITPVGVGIGVNFGISVPTNWRNWKCYQVYGSAQMNVMLGTGLYAGAGLTGNTSSTDGSLKTMYGGTYRYQEVDAGWGPSGSISRQGSQDIVEGHGALGWLRNLFDGDQWANDSVAGGSIGIRPRVGAGYGLWAGLGYTTGGGLATPTFGGCECD